MENLAKIPPSHCLVLAGSYKSNSYVVNGKKVLHSPISEFSLLVYITATRSDHQMQCFPWGENNNAQILPPFHTGFQRRNQALSIHG